MVAQDAQLKVYLEHAKRTLLIHHAMLAFNRTEHGLISVIVLTALFGRQSNQSHASNLLRDMKEVFSAPQTHRVQKTRETFNRKLPTITTVIERGGYVFPEDGEAVQRVGSEGCQQRSYILKK
jgi:hypothetical protein